MPERRGECRITAPTGKREARSMVAAVPVGMTDVRERQRNMFVLYQCLMKVYQQIF